MNLTQPRNLCESMTIIVWAAMLHCRAWSAQDVCMHMIGACSTGDARASLHGCEVLHIMLSRIKASTSPVTDARLGLTAV